MTLDQGLLIGLCLGVLALLAMIIRILFRLRRGDYDFTPSKEPARKPGISSVDSYLGAMKPPDAGPD